MKRWDVSMAADGVEVWERGKSNIYDKDGFFVLERVEKEDGEYLS